MASNRKYKTYEEFLAKRRASYRKRMKDPEYRKKRAENQRKYRERNLPKIEAKRKERYLEKKMAEAKKFESKLTQTTRIYEIKTI